jgi:hypothetical protein
MLRTLLILSAFLLPSAYAAPEFLCTTGDGQALFSDRGANAAVVQGEVVSRCLGSNATEGACAQLHCAREEASTALSPALRRLVFSSFANPKCDSDRDCPGFANRCFAGNCTQPGYQCDSDSDCPGFANRCFAGKCTRQEPLCESDRDCPGFANRCFAGKCTNP